MADFLFRMIKGALIGVGAILPGISGGVLCVVLGIYQPMMAFLAHPIQAFKRYGAFLLPVLLGWAVGVVGLARLVEWLLRTSEAPGIWLFIGLVVGTLPALYRDAGLRGRPKSSPLWVILGALLMAAVLLLLRGERLVTPTFGWWLVCGVLWGVGLVVPGLSPSAIFLYFGLYQPMMAGIGAFDFGVILPILIGMGATIALLAKGVNALFDRAYPQAMHVILGIVAASTVSILPLNPTGIGDIALYAVCFAAGCAVAVLMDHVGRRVNGNMG